MDDLKLDLSTPWMNYARMIYAMFGKDPEITVTYDQDENHIKLLVDNQAKADALTKILPEAEVFGNVTVKISIVPSNKELSTADIYRQAFSGNPAFVDVLSSLNPYAPQFTYILFKNKLVQYFNDQLNHPDGIKTITYEDIARNIFENSEGVFFVTETGDDPIVWP